MEWSFIRKHNNQACFSSAFNLKDMCSDVFVGNAKVKSHITCDNPVQ